ncbi:MAG: M20 family metallo-hydrolase [Rhodothermales bacterium]|nr:M20 family metallo-hydrolase [Rhodothermales bacterium]
MNRSRLLARLDDLARIGALEGGGVQRLAFTEQDLAGRRFVEHHLQRMDLTPRIDAIGNLWALRPGDHPDAAPVLLGSHTDSVGRAGRFDGSLGVLAALEVLEVLHENAHSTHRPVGLVSFVNEEGVRFMPDMMGSLYLRGDLDTDWVRAVRGTDGTTIGENLDKLGMAGSEDLRSSSVHAFLELHIEQGPVLEEVGLPVAVVTGVQGLRWLEITLKGTANHAGTTPMDRRQDAGLVAARVVVAMRECTQSIPGLRATVGRLVPSPNLINVIPGTVELTLDLRHPEQDTLDHAVERMRGTVAGLAEAEGVGYDIHETASAPAVQFDDLVVQAARDGAAALGLPVHELISGAGHDAQILARHCPSGMLFVRSRGGVSHNPAEYSSPEDVEAGANALLQAALRLAG